MILAGFSAPNCKIFAAQPGIHTIVAIQAENRPKQPRSLHVSGLLLIVRMGYFGVKLHIALANGAIVTALGPLGVSLKHRNVAWGADP